MYFIDDKSWVICFQFSSLSKENFKYFLQITKIACGNIVDNRKVE